MGRNPGRGFWHHSCRGTNESLSRGVSGLRDGKIITQRNYGLLRGLVMREMGEVPGYC